MFILPGGPLGLFWSAGSRSTCRRSIHVTKCRHSSWCRTAARGRRRTSTSRLKSARFSQDYDAPKRAAYGDLPHVSGTTRGNWHAYWRSHRSRRRRCRPSIRCTRDSEDEIRKDPRGSATSFEHPSPRAIPAPARSSGAESAVTKLLRVDSWDSADLSKRSRDVPRARVCGWARRARSSSAADP
jgi:hypothetical protein